MKELKRKNPLYAFSGNLLIIFLIIYGNLLTAQSIPPTGVSSACAYCAPPGWTNVYGSTDITNKVGWAGKSIWPWDGTVTDPPNGDTTWIVGYREESVSTNVTGLSFGFDYDLHFCMTELRSSSGGNPDQNFDGILGIFDCNTNILLNAFCFKDGPSNVWTQHKLTFTATATTQQLCFKYLIDPGSNGNFWNVSIGAVEPACSVTASVATTEIYCHGESTGTATAIGLSGTPPYTYQWTNGGNLATITGLTAGTYTVTVTDASGCSNTNQAIIAEQPAIQTKVLSTQIPCSGGTAVAIVTVTGGTPGYSYNWSSSQNGPLGQTTPAITGLTAGTYHVTVTDAFQCNVTNKVTIAPNHPISLTIFKSDISCYGLKDGSALVIIAGGTAPFQYSWSNGQTQATVNTLGTGNHTVTITDSFGCKAVETLTIAEPAPVFIDFEVMNVSCDSLNDGAVTAINVNGVPPISYQWGSNTGNQTTPTASNLGPGLYRVILTDANGCRDIGGVMVNTKDCGQPCASSPCVDAILSNTNICVALTNNPTDPLSTLDCDGDGVTNADECTDNTDPIDPCDYLATSITLPVTADQSTCPLPCPDLTPIMTILPGNIAGLSIVEVAIQISELDSVATNGTNVVVRMPSDPRFVFVWDIGLTMAALVPVQNADWNYLGNNGFVHIWTYNGPGLTIGAEGKIALGFQSFYDPQATDGQTTLTATVMPFSGGECNPLNNTDSERLVYFE